MSPHLDKSEKKYLLLDSCIIEYSLDKYIEPVLSAQIEQWLNESFNIGISQITYAELINGAQKLKETQVVEYLDHFYSFPVNQRVCIGAGKLGSVYKEFDSNLSTSVSMGDKIIAATSIITNSPIITANVTDFPFPFFVFIDAKNLIYKKKNKEIMLTIAVLQPNYPLINEKFGQRK